MHVCNVIGNSLPPLYVFHNKGQRRVVGILAGAPEGAQYALSESGYFTEEILSMSSSSKRTPASPRLLILDGHTSHVTTGNRIGGVDVCVYELQLVLV